MARVDRLHAMTLQRYNPPYMDRHSKRATVYFSPGVHQALRLKSVASSRSISEIVNEAVRRELAEDVEDLAAFDDRAAEPRMNFEHLVRRMCKR